MNSRPKRTCESVYRSDRKTRRQSAGRDQAVARRRNIQEEEDTIREDISMSTSQVAISGNVGDREWDVFLEYQPEIPQRNRLDDLMWQVLPCTDREEQLDTVDDEETPPDLSCDSESEASDDEESEDEDWDDEYDSDDSQKDEDEDNEPDQSCAVRIPGDKLSTVDVPAMVSTCVEKPDQILEKPDHILRHTTIQNCQCGSGRRRDCPQGRTTDTHR